VRLAADWHDSTIGNDIYDIYDLYDIYDIYERTATTSVRLGRWDSIHDFASPRFTRAAGVIRAASCETRAAVIETLGRRNNAPGFLRGRLAILVAE
jgi:hypothetical protein